MTQPTFHPTREMEERNKMRDRIAELKKLIAEQDAERYRWLRRVPVEDRSRIGDRDLYGSAEAFDVAIDDAMREEQ